MSMQKVLSKTFSADLTVGGSWGARDLGFFESTMDLYIGPTGGFIEWDIPNLEVTEEIGLWFDIDRDGKRTLTDYDGVSCLPKQAIEMMREWGIEVPVDFED